MIGRLVALVLRLLIALLVSALLFFGVVATIVGGGSSPGVSLLVWITLGLFSLGIWKLLRGVWRLRQRLTRWTLEHQDARPLPLGTWVTPRTGRTGRSVLAHDSWGSPSTQSARRRNGFEASEVYSTEYSQNTGSNHPRLRRRHRPAEGRS
jgi:membrane protein implicated in regulation of membrane protease activity